MGLKLTIQDFATKLGTIQVVTPDGVTQSLFVRVWNNQLEQLKAGELEAVPFPSCFIEPIVSQSQHGAIGQGVCGFNILFRVHLLHVNYNTEGSFEQNLVVFDLRDKVIRTMNRYKPLMCGPIDKISEGLDFEHDNVYHYTIDFNTHFVDLTGSDQDDETGNYTVSVPPLNLIINPDGPSYFDVNSFASFTQEPSCQGGGTAFFTAITFNKRMFFENGTKIRLDITPSNTITDIAVTGDGFTFDDQSNEVTITDVNTFWIINIAINLLNPLCELTSELTIVVADYEGLINHGVKGTQQTFNQTFTPQI